METRRVFLKKSAYVAPVVFTLAVRPSFATPPYARGNNGVGNGEDGQPPGNPPVNDGTGTSPGNPGNQGDDD
jgi:hypothetical protein